MAYYYPEPSHTFSEYLLVPGYTSEECMPGQRLPQDAPGEVSEGGGGCPISLNIPMVSAIMQAGVQRHAGRRPWPRRAGLSFIYGSQPIADEAAMVREVKSYKAGFVVSDSNLTPDRHAGGCAGPEGTNRPLHHGRHRGRHRPPASFWASSPAGTTGSAGWSTDHQGQRLHDPAEKSSSPPRTAPP